MCKLLLTKDYGLVVVVEVITGRPTKGDIGEFLEEGLDSDIDCGLMDLELKKNMVRCSSENTSDTYVELTALSNFVSHLFTDKNNNALPTPTSFMWSQEKMLFYR